MEKDHPRISREKRTIDAMIAIYCKDHHGSSGGALCEGCSELLSYAHARLDRCRYAHRKPACGNCPVHCYGRAMKERVIDVMKYSGPRMTFRHPWFALMHILDGFRKPPALLRKKAIQAADKAVDNR